MPHIPRQSRPRTPPPTMAPTHGPAAIPYMLGPWNEPGPSAEVKRVSIGSLMQRDVDPTQRFPGRFRTPFVKGKKQAGKLSLWNYDLDPAKLFPKYFKRNG